MPDSWSNIFVGLACITAFRVKRPLDGIYLWSPKAANGIISLFSITQEYSAVCVCMCMYVLSRFSCVWLFATPWTIACQAPLSVSFSRQEYWSGWPCPPPGGLPNPEIEPLCILHWQAGYLFTITATWEDRCVCVCVCIFVCVCVCMYIPYLLYPYICQSIISSNLTTISFTKIHFSYSDKDLYTSIRPNQTISSHSSLPSSWA